MPRYFFNVDDGFSTKDAEGTDLPDIFAAQEEAIRLSGELLREIGGEFWNGTEWSLTVTYETGRVLFILRFSADKGTVIDGGS
jgi:Domain of unknown function (DUF6894)